MAEALPEITDEKIEKAALPEGKRANEEVSEESTFIELEGKDLEGLPPIEEEKVTEDFKTSKHVEKEAEGIENEAEKRAKLAQNRIDKAVKQAKNYQRRELQALQYAKQIAEENNNLKNQQAQMSHNYGAEFGARVESQLEGSKIALQKAMEEGESDKIAEAQSILAAASADKVAYDQYQGQLQRYNQEMEQYNAQQQVYAQEQRMAAQQQSQQPVYQPPSQKAQSWASDNTWFGKDQVMTNVAIAVHEQLAQEGFDTESDDYYSEINKRMKQELPNRFKNNVGADGKLVQTVASPSRSNSNGRRKNRNQVELTPSEQQLAKRLGVSFKDYAIHKARLDNS
jgi:hypothetical protein